MTCWLCGHEDEGRHHLGCYRASNPNLTQEVAVELGLLPRPTPDKEPEPDKVEILKEGSMTTVLADETGHTEGVATIAPGDDGCEYEDCEEPKYSDHPRVKYCEVHKDPKNRKE